MLRHVNKVLLYENPAALAAAAAEQIEVGIALALQARGRYLLALSGGSTPQPLFERLATAPFRERIPWDSVLLFWGDERCVPPDAAGSNYGQVKQVLLDRLETLPPENVFPMRGELSPAEAARDYTEQLRQAAGAPDLFPRMDLTLLGMGEDGHTASLFPGPLPDGALTRPVVPVTADYGDRPADRVTLTPMVLNASRQVIFLVTGKAKAKMVANILGPEGEPWQYPAGRIRLDNGEVSWLLDRDAAAML
jgi:6-phosphogluconolactonase